MSIYSRLKTVNSPRNVGSTAAAAFKCERRRADKISDFQLPMDGVPTLFLDCPGITGGQVAKCCIYVELPQNRMAKTYFVVV
jgi:hypothetical protein